MRPHTLDLLIADISGHGIGEAILLSNFMSMVRSLELLARAPAEAANLANKTFSRTVADSGKYVTGVFASIDLEAKTLVYTTMGHYAPILCRAGLGEVLQRTKGLPAGLWEAPGDYEQTTVALEPGDALLFFTDGLIEARSPTGQPLGVGGLVAMLDAARGSSAQALMDSLQASWLDFVGSGPLEDDTSVILVKLQA